MVGKKGPFGGFCNYGIFGIWGKDPETGKKKYKKVDAVSEVAAVEKAAALGCVDPQSVEVIQFLPPSEKQQRYAADLGVDVENPHGCGRHRVDQQGRDRRRSGSRSRSCRVCSELRRLLFYAGRRGGLA